MFCHLRNQEMKYALKISLFIALLLQDFSSNNSSDWWVLYSKFNFMFADNFTEVQKNFIFHLCCLYFLSVSLTNIRVDNLTEHCSFEISSTFFKNLFAVFENKE